MEFDQSLEHQILFRNALRLGASTYARNERELEEAIRKRLHELGYRDTSACSHCRRAIPDFGICPYCSAPTNGQASPAPRGSTALTEHLSLAALNRSVTSPQFWIIVLLAGAPMLLSFFGLSEKWMFVYFSGLWAYVFFKVTGVRRDLWKAGVLGYVLTGVVVLPLLVAWISIPPHLTETAVSSESALVRFLGFFLGVGIREELAKVLPVLWLATLKVGGRRVIERPVEALVVGSMCGLGFAAIENMDYVERFQFLDRVHYTFGLYGDNLTFRGSMSRVMLTPFVHAVWAGVASYFAMLAVQERGAARRKLFFTGLILAALLHGVYDLFAGYASGDILIFSVVAFSFAVWLACYERTRTTGDG